jgi:outer membrane protein OmpA-like peptidoglycan-associated protein
MKINLRTALASAATTILLASSFTIPASANGPGVCGTENFAGGTGIVNDPYQIHDANALSELRDCGASEYHYYKLTSDIELTGNWQEIATFTGSLDGDNHEINGIYVAGVSQYNGFFKNLTSADIFNLGISGTVVSYHWSTGLLAGSATDSSFQNILAASQVTGVAVTGGLVGEAYGSSFEDITVNPLTPSAEISVSDGTVGGIIGLAENTSLNDLYSNVDIVGTDSASYVGGVVGIDRTTQENPVVLTQTNLNYTGDITSQYDGSGICGGIVGAEDHIISYASVIGSTIRCESSINGGVVGYGSNSVSFARVEANIEVASLDQEQAGLIGGIIGYWSSGRNDDYVFEGNSFVGTIDSALQSAGLIAYLIIDELDETSSFSFSKSFVRANFISGNNAGGFISTLYSDGDMVTDNDAIISLSESYSDVSFGTFGGSTDPIIYFLNFPGDIDSVVWKNNGDTTTSYESEVVESNLETMQRPGFWKNLEWEMEIAWGMSTSVNDGLPVIRNQYEATFDVNCENRAFPDLNFAKNQTSLSKKAKRTINTFASNLKNGDCLNLYVAAFASGKEVKKGKKKTAYQQTLSNKRLSATLRYLNSKLSSSDVDFQIVQNALGSKYKKNKDKTKKQQAANRRVEIGTIS